MKLKIRYDDSFQKIDLNFSETVQLINSLGLPQAIIMRADYAKIIQGEWNKQFNYPEYNSLHTHQRHSSFYDDATPKNARDSSIFYDAFPDEIVTDDVVCQFIKETFSTKPTWADAMIHVCLNGMTIRKYAESHRGNESSISQQLKRAKKKLLKILLSQAHIADTDVDGEKKYTLREIDMVREYIKNSLKY